MDDKVFYAILERVKRSRSLNQDVFETLDKMEILQSTVNIWKAIVKRIIMNFPSKTSKMRKLWLKHNGKLSTDRILLTDLESREMGGANGRYGSREIASGLSFDGQTR